MGSLDALNWKLSGTAIKASCQVDLVIFLTCFPFSLHPPTLLSLFYSLYFAPLFIPLLFISSLLDFSLPAPVPSFSLSAFLSTTIFTRRCDMTAGPVNGESVTDADECVTGSCSALLSFTLPSNIQVCHALGIDIIVREHFGMLACTLESFIMVYLWMKYFHIEGCHINMSGKVVYRCQVSNGLANFHADLKKEE